MSLTSNRWLRVLFVAATVVVGVAAGLTAGWHAGVGPAAKPPAGVTAAAAVRATATRVDLGKAICGDCCETRIWRAVGNLAGVKDVSTTVGQSTIVVHHDGREGLDASLVTALATEWSAAVMVDVTGAPVPAAREWIRPVVRATSR